MSQATSSLTPDMDSYGIPQAIKMLDCMSEEVMSMVDNSSGDESDDEREKKGILQCMECFNRLFIVASSSVQLYYEKYILKQLCMDAKQSGEAWIQEILDGHGSHYMINFRMSKIVFTSLLRALETRYNLQTSRHISSRENVRNFFVHLGHWCKSFPMSRKISKDCIGAIDDTHIVTILPPNEQILYIGRKGVPTQN
ncbi:hypothetical protein Gogos_019801, partial [Gossypium gossypioides]|nr:hypothetical protein [Gossypium gossypioides]